MPTTVCYVSTTQGNGKDTHRPSRSASPEFSVLTAEMTVMRSRCHRSERVHWFIEPILSSQVTIYALSGVWLRVPIPALWLVVYSRQLLVNLATGRSPPISPLMNKTTAQRLTTALRIRADGMLIVCYNLDVPEVGGTGKAALKTCSTQRLLYLVTRKLPS